MTKIFLTGTSGYIGGQVLYDLVAGHPEYEITTVVRSSASAKRIEEAYPKVRVLQGDFDDVELIEREASQANIVLHLGANKHIPSVEAIHSGLKKQDGGHWIQVSGASGLASREIADSSFQPGSPSDAVWDDLNGVADIRSLIRAHSFRQVDNYILDVAANDPKIKTAVVWPPIIYGEGQGPVNQRSIQIPTLSRVAIEKGHAVQAGDALNRWGNVHIRDLGKLFHNLVEAAVKGDQPEKLWGENGIYLTASGETTFADISQRISRAALDQKLIKDDKIDKLVKPELDQVLPAGSVMYGTNARGEGKRAKELLGWAPKEHSLEDEIPKTVTDVASRKA
ncbi:hypothetical protein FDECE_4346 [Fusarium decemcellulare]|nr:hypothetical protein FDECE_4346 [Fusarium decemcellulare]